MSNIFNGFDNDIWAHANLPGNAALLERTGSYSALMRGGLFGKYRQEEVVQALHGGERVNVLMLGSNPNAGAHQTKAVREEYGTLPEQMATGMLGEQKWDGARNSKPGWNFLVDSNEGWKYFRRLLEEVTPLDRVAMCNFIPWGSNELPELFGAIEPAVLKAALQFCEELNASLVKLLQPRIVIIPTSLTNKAELNRVYRTAYLDDMRRAQKTATPLPKKRFFHYAGEMTFNAFTTKTLHVAHPGYFARVSLEDRLTVSNVLKPVLQRALLNEAEHDD